MICKFFYGGIKLSKYNTIQRGQLEKLFFENIHIPLSAKQIHSKLPQMSISTIYRNLNSMQKDGLISSRKTASNEKIFQYLDPCSCSGIVHLICEGCGTAYHIDKNISKLLIDVAKDDVGFTISQKNITLYGICKNCN